MLDFVVAQQLLIELIESCMPKEQFYAVPRHHISVAVKGVTQEKDPLVVDTLHPQEQTWNLTMEIWKTAFLFKGLYPGSFLLLRGVFVENHLFSLLWQCTERNATIEILLVCL